MSRDRGLVIAELRDAMQDMVASKREIAKLINDHADVMEKDIDRLVATASGGIDVNLTHEFTVEAMKIQREISLAKMKNSELEQKMVRLGLEFCGCNP